MERPPAYQPLCRDDEDEIQAQLEEKDGTAWNANSTEIIPTNTRSFVIFLSILLLSLSANVLLVMDNAKLRTARNTGKTVFTGLAFDTPIPYRAMSEYWHPNATDSEMEAAWDTIDTNAIAVALHDDWADSVGLAPSTRFPWDTERSVYYVKGVHDLHCLKLIRKAIVSKHNGDNHTFSLNHIYHCLDGIRQDIMCIADDTPMPASVAHHVGDGQIRQCRDWNNMRTTITLLPLFAFAAGIMAAPTPLRPLPRAVPDLKTVIRNPVPILDEKASLEVPGIVAVKVDLSEISKPLEENLKERAAPAMGETLVDPVHVIGRATPAVDKIIWDPVHVIN
ncbi:hypothetical protein N0V83_010096 [Neocucurbitaria cava]|uniref:Uncharacterized protein n=1 Tax=Neocucurbitaria cava TaxID=798079 RepID=A0A9W9CHN6_9PLEO|nr:hypothetical protein N0V83_010096 [Neocucurbitaria cava]